MVLEFSLAAGKCLSLPALVGSPRALLSQRACPVPSLPCPGELVAGLPGFPKQVGGLGHLSFLTCCPE